VRLAKATATELPILAWRQHLIVSFSTSMAMKMNEDAGPSYGFFGTVNSRVQHIFDRLTPHIAPRWIVCFLLFLVYFIRVFNLKGWYIVTYGLGIYLLNQLIGFISPQVR
jgi:hypothetical protein